MVSLLKEFGKHYLVELMDCDAELLKRVKDVEPVLMEAVRRSGATVIRSHTHQFEPYGVTAVVLIADSHFSLHTWPQDRYASFDVQTCGDMDVQAAVQCMRDGLKAQRVEVQTVTRGIKM
jgi:S-adenosylmethionine decarboxylase